MRPFQPSPRRSPFVVIKGMRIAAQLMIIEKICYHLKLMEVDTLEKTERSGKQGIWIKR